MQLLEAHPFGLHQQLIGLLDDEEIEEELALRREQSAVGRSILANLRHVAADQTLEKGTCVTPVQREHSAVGKQDVSGC
jgi:hypothetical protein